MTLPRDAVVVVGGGLAGLTAAAELARARVRSVLFNAAVDLGGRARTECRAGFHFNLGPHRLYERGAAVAGLRRLDVTIDGAARGPNGGLAIRGGVKHTLPVGCFSLLTTGLLPPSAKREIAKFLSEVPSVEVSALQGVPVADWLGTCVQDPCVLQFVLALIRLTTYCDEPDRLSAAAAVDQLKLSLTGSVLYIHHGWGTLVAALREASVANGATLVAGHAVAAVNVEAGRATSVTLSDRTLVPCGAVIVATGPRQADQLLGDGMPALPPISPVSVATLDVALLRLRRSGRSSRSASTTP